MKLYAILALVPLVAAIGAPDPELAGRVAIAAPAPGTPVRVTAAAPVALAARACATNGCKCRKVPQSQYCGNCVLNKPPYTDYVVTSKRTATHVYECNPSGGCCDYGPAGDCGSGAARCP